MRRDAATEVSSKRGRLDALSAELLIRIIECFARPPHDDHLLDWSATPALIQNHRTLLSLSRTGRLLHRLTEPILYSVVGPFGLVASDDGTAHQARDSCKRLARSLAANHDLGRFRYTKVLEISLPLKGSGVVVNALEACSRVEQLHVRFEPVGKVAHYHNTDMPLSPLSTEAAATLQQVKVLRITTISVKMRYRQSCIQWLLQHCRDLDHLIIDGMLHERSSRGSSCVPCGQKSVRKVTLKADEANNTNSCSLKLTLQAIDVQNVEELHLSWLKIPSGLSTITGMYDFDWLSLHTIHLEGHHMTTAGVTNRICSDMLQWIQGVPRLRVLHVAEHHTYTFSRCMEIIATLPRVPRQVDTLVFNWPSRNVLPALKRLRENRALFAQDLEGIQCIRFIPQQETWSMWKPQWDPWSYSAAFVLEMRDYFDQDERPVWIQEAPKLSAYFVQHAVKVEPAHFWESLRANLERLQLDPSVDMEEDDLQEYWQSSSVTGAEDSSDREIKSERCTSPR